MKCLLSARERSASFFDRLYELFCDQKKHLMSNIRQGRAGLFVCVGFFPLLFLLYGTLHLDLYVEGCVCVSNTRQMFIHSASGQY